VVVPLLLLLCLVRLWLLQQVPALLVVLPRTAG
jgi:hypothetical protein